MCDAAGFADPAAHPGRIGRICYSAAMPAKQADLSESAAPARPQPNPKFVEMVRQRLHATVALVKAAKTMPWTGRMTIIGEDNEFRLSKTCCRRRKARRYGPSSTSRWTGCTSS